ncbi:MAG: hypothetical protein ACOY71_12130 [Gemmatimonadota bacterium]
MFLAVWRGRKVHQGAGRERNREGPDPPCRGLTHDGCAGPGRFDAKGSRGERERVAEQAEQDGHAVLGSLEAAAHRKGLAAGAVELSAIARRRQPDDGVLAAILRVQQDDAAPRDVPHGQSVADTQDAGHGAGLTRPRPASPKPGNQPARRIDPEHLLFHPIGDPDVARGVDVEIYRDPGPGCGLRGKGADLR